MSRLAACRRGPRAAPCSAVESTAFSHLDLTTIFTWLKRPSRRQNCALAALSLKTRPIPPTRLRGLLPHSFGQNFPSRGLVVKRLVPSRTRHLVLSCVTNWPSGRHLCQHQPTRRAVAPTPTSPRAARPLAQPPIHTKSC